jgi:Cof subfamily protein (haloacid dehalogenase superfamily)
VQAFACDLDGTLIGRDATLRPRTLAAISRAQAAGIPVLVATGRMFRSVEPYLERAGIQEPVVCYQGAAVVDPRTREFLLHEPLELDLAREAVALLLAHDLAPNVYVDDQLYVAEETEYSRAYSNFQSLPVTEVGDLLAWLERPPTKLVAVAEPERLAEVRSDLEAVFEGRMFITTSLPHLLELGHLGASKGSGIAFVAQLLGIELDKVIAFGDGENDVELLAEVGLAVAVEGAHPRLQAIAQRTCPGPHDEGVAGVIEAVLDSRG